jgi:hypothetical protein
LKTQVFGNGHGVQQGWNAGGLDDYLLKNVIEQLPEEISGRALSPIAEHLFAVRDES